MGSIIFLFFLSLKHFAVETKVSSFDKEVAFHASVRRKESFVSVNFVDLLSPNLRGGGGGGGRSGRGREVGDSSSDLVTSCWNAQLVYKMLES
jgi:hypothetical protein